MTLHDLDGPDAIGAELDAADATLDVVAAGLAPDEVAAYRRLIGDLRREIEELRGLRTGSDAARWQP